MSHDPKGCPPEFQRYPLPRDRTRIRIIIICHARDGLKLREIGAASAHAARARCAHARMATSRADRGVIVGLRPEPCSSRNASLAPREAHPDLSTENMTRVEPHHSTLMRFPAIGERWGLLWEALALGAIGHTKESVMSGSDRMLVQQAQATSHPCSFIDPVPPAALSRASGKGTWMNLRGTSGITNGDRTFASAAATTTSIAGAELAICTIRATMRLTTSSGSRSPAASGQRRLLGVLQALAQHDLLRRFDYLSTVSGGGYIGTSLTWLTSRLAAKPPRRTDEATRPKFRSRSRHCPRWLGLGPSDRKPPSPAIRRKSAPHRSLRQRRPTNRTRARPGESHGRDAPPLRQHGNYLTPGEGIALTSVIVVLLQGMILNLLCPGLIIAGRHGT